MWFEELTGFREESPEQVRSNLTLEGTRLTSRINGRTLECGTLEIPSLAELRERARAGNEASGRTRARELIGDVRELHRDPANAGALFQVASQFNLLEMIGPEVTPEEGVGRYEGDPTQGPACAIAAGAGTIYRNYFVEVEGRRGQSDGRQIDCLHDVGQALGNSDGRLWEMRNGYALASVRGLVRISEALFAASEADLDALRQRLRIGLQWKTQVTLPDCSHAVSQAYCSALPVGYSGLPARLWEPFARLVLEAAYEATFCAAIANKVENGDDRLFLTLLGGGAFGNDLRWISGAIARALSLHRYAGLDVSIVSFRHSRGPVRGLVDKYVAGG